MEWVEVRGKTVDVAVQAALVELGLESVDQAEIEVLQEPERGFLGLGGRDAIVRVKPRPEGKRRRRRRKRGGGPGRGEGERERQPRGEGRKAEGRKAAGGERGRPETRREAPKPKPAPKEKKASERPARREAKPEVAEVDINEQAVVVKEFLGGLVDAFGLEGTVDVYVEEDVIVADVSGPQTEAMVGPRGAVIEAVHELTKTVLQRRTESSARVRLDIAGYGERRRQALAIYANQLIDQVISDGGEVMLEPMSASDRKVIHDAAAAREGVQSYSEGEAPQRYVVLAAVRQAGVDEEE